MVGSLSSIVMAQVAGASGHRNQLICTTGGGTLPAGTEGTNATSIVVGSGGMLL